MNNPTRPSLRQLLMKVFPTDSDVEELCIDCFPDVKSRFTNTMDRKQKLNLLMELNSADEILNPIRRYYKDRIAPHEAILEYDQSSSSQGAFITESKSQLELSSKGQSSSLMMEIQELKKLILSQSAIPLEEKIRLVEAANPGLSFTAQTTASHTSYTVSAKPGEKIRIGHLAFPNNDVGQKAIEKFNNAQDLGIPAQFDPEECKFESDISWPWRKPDLGNLGIAIQPIAPKTRTAVKIHCKTKSGRLRKINLAYMSTIRRGRKEVEVKISEGMLAGAIYFILSKEGSGTTEQEIFEQITARCSVKIDYDWIQLKPEQAILTADLYLAAHDSQIYIDSLERGPLFGTKITAALETVEFFMIIREILSCLIIVNRRFKLSLHYPEFLDFGTYKQIWVLSRLAEAGKLNIPVTGGTVGFELLPLEAIRLISQWNEQEGKAISFTMNIRSYTPKLLGHDICFGDLTVHVIEALPAFDVKKTLALANVLPAEQAMRLEFSCKELGHILKKDQRKRSH